MTRKKIVAFILFAYFISWLIWLPNLLANYSVIDQGYSGWLHAAGGLGPFLGAMATTFIFDKQQGLKRYIHNRFLQSGGVKWVGVGIGMPVLFFLAVALIFFIIGNPINLSELGLTPKIPLTNPLLIWLAWCLFYGVGEESGWRGYLFPEFTKEYPARISTLYVAFFWVPWHLPLFFFDPNFSTMGVFGAVGWVVSIVFGSLLLGWLTNQAKFSLWSAILWHGTFNFFTASERLNPLLPGLMSAMVIIFTLWIARKYGENLDRITIQEKV